MATEAIVRAQGRITIPAEIRTATHLEEGDAVEVEVVSEGILIRPKKSVDDAQEWFSTPHWQAKEREADEERDAGLGQIFYSDEEFLAALDSWDGDAHV